MKTKTKKFVGLVFGTALAFSLVGAVCVGGIHNEAIQTRAAEGGPDSDGYYYDTFGAGTFDTDHITWSMASNKITMTQYKGTGTSNVNSSYATAARVYKGHYLAFVATGGYKIHKVEITCSSTYYGNSMTAGTVVSEDVVTDDATNISRTWTSTSGGTHVVESVSSDGVTELYVQNVGSSGITTQLRWASGGVKVYYSKGAATYVTSVTLSGNSSISEGIKGGASVKLTPTVTYSDSSIGEQVTWSLTDSSTYSESSTSTIASIDKGVVTFSNNGTVYAWATSVDQDAGGNLVHNTTGFAITASNLLDGNLLDKNSLNLQSSYGSFVSKIDGVDYGGYASGQSTYIQMNSSSAVYTKTTGGLLKYLTFTIDHGSEAINVYYSNSPFTSLSDVTGTPDKVVTESEGFTISGDYQYFAFKPDSKAVYIKEIRTAWQEVLPTSLVATPSSVETSIGGSQQVELEFVNSSGFVVSNKDVAWASSNTSIATVVDGEITGVAEGNTTVRATSQKDSSVYVDIPVNVSASAILVESITLDKAEVEIYEEQTATVTATILPANATDKTVTWSSEDDSVATVSDAGVITGVGEGITTITCAANDASGVSQSVTVYVYEFNYSPATSLNGGDKVIITGADSEHKAFLKDFSSTSPIYGKEQAYDSLPFDAVSDYVYSVVAGVNENTLAFKNSEGKYLTWASGNGVKVDSTLNSNASWTVSFDGTVATIANVADSTRVLRHNYGSARFACYTSATGVLITLYKLGSSAGDAGYAEAFAENFNDAFLGAGSFCDPDGQTTDTTELAGAWEIIASDYEALNDGTKAYIASKSASVSGDSVEKMLEQYNYIFGKYGSALSLENFLQRKEAPKSLGNVSYSLFGNTNDNTAFIVIAVFTLVSVAGLAGYFLLKKKEQ